MEENNFSIDGLVKALILAFIQLFLNKIFKIPELPNEILSEFGIWDYFKLIFPVSFVLGLGLLLLFSKKIRHGILGNSLTNQDISFFIGVFALLLFGSAFLTYWLFPDKDVFSSVPNLISYSFGTSGDGHNRVYKPDVAAAYMIINILYRHYKIVGMLNFILTIILAILIANYSYDKITEWMDGDVSKHG